MNNQFKKKKRRVNNKRIRNKQKHSLKRQLQNQIKLKTKHLRIKERPTMNLETLTIGEIMNPNILKKQVHPKSPNTRPKKSKNLLKRNMFSKKDKKQDKKNINREFF